MRRIVSHPSVNVLHKGSGRFSEVRNTHQAAASSREKEKKPICGNARGLYYFSRWSVAPRAQVLEKKAVHLQRQTAELLKIASFRKIIFHAPVNIEQIQFIFKAETYTLKHRNCPS